jgi:hypothetical protein
MRPSDREEEVLQENSGAEEGEAEDEVGLEEMIAGIGEGIEMSTFETDTETREAENVNESESETGEIREILGCADHRLGERDRQRGMREISGTVSGIYPQD